LGFEAAATYGSHLLQKTSYKADYALLVGFSSMKGIFSKTTFQARCSLAYRTSKNFAAPKPYGV
jgi:hypothetical protein